MDKKEISKEGRNMGQSNLKAYFFVQTGYRKLSFTVLL